ncbi:MAG: chromosomal replication initiator protein DnaA [Clostridiales bacterium]|nr:chromosomal replication initiator protein DnaA [Clostridiales bacterium]
MNEVKKIWLDVLGILEREISSTITYDVWIKTLEAVDIEGEKLILCAPSESNKLKVNREFKTLIVSVLKSLNTLITDVEIVVNGEYEKREEFVEEKIEDLPAKVEANVINPKYTFDNFVVGKCNQLAYAAARAVAEEPGQHYNPLFIYGGVGLGKTHIMQAIGNAIRKQKPNLKVLYIPSEKFVNEYVMSVRKGGNSSDFGKQFREKYRNLDVLMMDDIQFVSKKPETQNELFHTFNDLTQAGKQIIFASDRAPSEIPDLEDRLRSRFEWGLIADIQQPDMETRIAILQKKALAQKVVIANDVLTYMAQRLATNIREMESMLNKVILLGKLYNKPITVELAQETFKDYSEPTEEAVGAEDVIDCTCKYFDVKKEDLLGKKRDKKIVEPRQICIYVISEMLPLPLTTIGEIMGGRDHTTVLHAKNKVASLLGKDERFDKAITDIKNMIYKK